MDSQVCVFNKTLHQNLLRIRFASTTDSYTNMAFIQYLVLFILSVVLLNLPCVCCNENLNLTRLLNSTTPEQCPTWYLPAKNGSGSCVCGDTINNKIECLVDQQVGLLDGNCMTYTDNQTLIGLCPYSPHRSDAVTSLYTTVPKNISELDDFMCGWNKRTGLLCSQCKDGLTLAVLSYEKVCMDCSEMSAYMGVFLFLVLAFVPTTLFFLLVMGCSIDISSGPMNSFLTIIQTILIQINQNPTDMIFKSNNSLTYYPVVFLVTFYGIWLLDFFRYVIPPFCISKSLTLLQSEALEYVIAVYPLLLIVATYVCIELYDNENKLMRLLWTPFKRVSKCKCFKNWNIKYSLISSFATFLELAYARIFFISKGLLNYTYVKNSTGDSIMTVVQGDASVRYMSSAHIPYVIIAILMSMIFIVLPLLLLLLYPTRWFQLLLGMFNGVNWHPLRAVMDIFQGCYKNGTDGTNDCRYFAAFHFLFRILILFPIDNHTYSVMKLVVVPVLFGFLIALFRPYRNNAYNIWDTFCFCMYFADQLLLLCATYDSHLSLDFLYFSHFILLVYFFLLVIAKVMKMVAPRLYDAIKDVFRGSVSLKVSLLRWRGREGGGGVAGWEALDGGRQDLEAQHGYHEITDDLPDRLNNPQDYEPLLQHLKVSLNSSTHTVLGSYGIPI